MAADDKTIQNLTGAIERLIKAVEAGGESGNGDKDKTPKPGESVIADAISAAQAEAAKQFSETIEELNKRLEKKQTLEQMSVDNTKKTAEEFQAFLELLKEAEESGEEVSQEFLRQGKQLQLNLAAQKQQLLYDKEQAKLAQEEVDNAKKAQELFNKAGETAAKFKDHLVGAIKAAKGEMDDFITSTTGVSGLSKQLFSFTGMFSKLKGDIYQGVQDFDQAVADLNKQGLGNIVTSLGDAQVEFAQFGMGAKEAAGFLQGLGSSTSTFRFESEDARKEIIKTAGAFNKLGVDGAAFGELQATLSRNLKMNSDQVADFGDRLAGLSKTTGKSVASLVSDFNQAGDGILQFGDKAADVFMDTQKIAAKFGISVSDVLDVFDKFDTVEGAADIVGRLNAQFGTQIDMLSLMRAETPEERFNMLRESLEATGRSFSDLSRLEQKAMADIMGKDIGFLDRMMGDGAVLTESQQALKDLAESAMSVGERAKAIFDKIVAKLQKDGVFEKIQKVLTETFAEGGPFEKFANMMLPVAIRAVSYMVSGFKTFLNVANAVLPVIGFIGRAFIDFVMTPVYGVINLFKGLVGILGGVFDIIVGIFTFDFGRIVDGFKGIFGGLVKGVIGVFQLAITFFAPARILAFLGRPFMMFGGLVLNMFKGVGKGVGSVFGKLLGPIKSVFGKVTGFIGNFATKAKDSVKSVTAPFTKLKDGLTSALTKAKDFAVGAFTKIKDTAVGAFTKAKEMTVGAFTKAKDMVVGAFAKVKDTIGGAVNFVKEKFGAVGAAIAKPFVAVGNFIRAKLITPIQNFLAKVQNKIRSVMNKIRKIPGASFFFGPAETVAKAGAEAAKATVRAGTATAVQTAQGVAVQGVLNATGGNALIDKATGVGSLTSPDFGSTPAPEQALARGGIIKPGASGIVGDPITPGVPNIERVTVTSQGAMVQPMAASGGGTGGAQQATIVLNVDGNEMGKTVVDLLDGQYNTVLGN